MKKRLLQIFFLCLPLAVLLTVSAGAVIASGTWEDVTWSISDSGQLTIGSSSGILNGQKPLEDGEKPPSGGFITESHSSSGEIRRFANGGWRNREYVEQTTSIVIQNGVTHIKDNVFNGQYDNVKELLIPESVTVIDYYAFGIHGLESLKKVTIPASCLSRQSTWVRLDGSTIDGLIRPLSEIGNFGKTLEEIVITGNAADLDKSVFDGYTPTLGTSRGFYTSLSFSCPNLKKVTFPYGLTTIWNGAFEDCTGLTEMTIPQGVTNIGDEAFKGCTGLTKITIPEGVTKLGDMAFYGCSNLKSINFPSSLTTIGIYAFARTGFTEIAIPSNVTSIGRAAFERCENLKKVVLPNGLTKIEDDTFGFCMNLEEITIPVSVTSIDSSAFTDWRYDKTDSHLGKIHLKGVYYEGTEEQWNQIEGVSRTEVLNETTVYYNSPMPVITPTSAPVSVPVQSGQFEDVAADAYYADAVKWAVDKGVTNGVSATNFAPADTCTRGQVATFLWRANGKPEPVTTENPFTDVDPSSAFYKAILWAAENGITAGTSDTTFSPGNPCTRAHVVTFLWRTQGKPEAAGDAPLADSFPQGYYTDAVRWADAAGLLNGTGEAFTPSALCPRADIVTYLYRVLT